MNHATEFMPVECLCIPKALFFDKRYENLSVDAKILYSLLLDRKEMAVRNGWIDRYGAVYVLYSREEMEKHLNAPSIRVERALAQLEAHDQMVAVARPYKGRADQIYVRDITADQIIEQEEENMGKTNTTCDGAGTFIAAKGRSINYYYDIPILKLPIQLRKIPEKYRKTFSRKYSRETRTFLLCQIYRQPDFITNDVIKKDWKDRQKYSKQLLRYFDYYWQTPKEDTVIGKDYMYKLRTVPVKMWKTEMEDN